MQDGLRIVRAPFDWRLAVPGLRGGARARADAAMALPIMTDGGPGNDDASGDLEPAPVLDRPALPVRVVRGVGRRIKRPWRRWRRLVLMFPLLGMGWAAALERVAEPADVWHGMWAGSLPVLGRMRKRFGGRTIYDSRDIYMEARSQATAGWPGKAILAALERRWARRADTVLTVNESYATVLEERLEVPRPAVVMNVPRRWAPPEPAPDLIRSALDLPATTRIVLYQGGLDDRSRHRASAWTPSSRCPTPSCACSGSGRCARRLDGGIERAAAPRAGVPAPRRAAGRAPRLDRVRRRLGDDDPADVAQPPAHHAPEAVREHHRGRAGRGLRSPRDGTIVRSDDVGLVCDPRSPARSPPPSGRSSTRGRGAAARRTRNSGARRSALQLGGGGARPARLYRRLGAGSG